MNEDDPRHRRPCSEGASRVAETTGRHARRDRVASARRGARQGTAQTLAAEARVDEPAHARDRGPGGQRCGLRHPRPSRSRRGTVSVSCDVNVLLYASDSSSPVHGAARRFLDEAVAAGDLFCVGWPTVMSYLRIATHPGIFSAPLAPAEALRNIEALLA